MSLLRNDSKQEQKEFRKEDNIYYKQLAIFFMVNNHSMYKEERLNKGSNVALWEGSFLVQDKDTKEIIQAQKELAKLKLPFNQLINDNEMLHGIYMAFDFHRQACENTSKATREKLANGTAHTKGETPYVANALWALNTLLDEEFQETRQNKAIQIFKAYNKIIKISYENKQLVEKKLSLQVKEQGAINKHLLMQMLTKVGDRIVYLNNALKKEGNTNVVQRFFFHNIVADIIAGPKKHWANLNSKEVSAINKLIEDEAATICTEFFGRDIVDEMNDALGIENISTTIRVMQNKVKENINNIYSYDFYNRITKASKKNRYSKEDAKENDSTGDKIKKQAIEESTTLSRFPLSPEILQAAIEAMKEDGFTEATMGLKKYSAQTEKLRIIWEEFLAQESNEKKELSDLLTYEEVGEWIFDGSLSIRYSGNNVNIAILTRKTFFILWKINEKLNGELNTKTEEHSKTLADYNHDFNQIINSIKSGALKSKEKLYYKMYDLWQGLKNLLAAIPVERVNHNPWQGECRYVAIHPDILIALLKIKGYHYQREVKSYVQNSLFVDFEEREFKSMPNKMEDYFQIDPNIKKMNEELNY